MTEKRFSCTENGFVVDYKSEHKLLNLYDVVDCLNDLSDENEQLKKEINKLETFKKILDYAEKDMEERADWQSYCEKEFEGL